MMRRKEIPVQCGPELGYADSKADAVEHEFETQFVTAGSLLYSVEHRPWLPPDSPWWDAPNVTVTPHLSGPDQHDGVARLFAENVRRVRAGQRPRGEVDRGRGY